ncbi:MAG: PrpR N-terminal domain-containing protein, partial [Planctomycetes bacterium]|nr:PrpR N-terminal domain-containing protein [Planctomycetota bacterium]
MSSYYLFLAPIREIKTIALQVIAERGAENWVVEHGSNERGVRIARRHVARGARLIVSRGITCRMLRRLDLPVPVIDMGQSPYELLHILADSQVAGKRVGVIGSTLTDQEITLFNRIFACDIRLYPATAVDEIENLVRLAHASGVEVVVGGLETQHFASRLGLESVRLVSGRSTVVNAIERAMEIDAARRREKCRAEQIHAILDFCFDGILVTDSAGDIIMANKTAADMLGVEHRTIVGQPCR